MARVKAKTTMKRTPLSNQRMATTKKPTIKSSNSKSTAKPKNFKMSAAARRIMSVSKDTVISRLKTQVKKDTNKKFKSGYTVESIGRKPRRGRGTPWIEFPELEALLYQDEKSAETYTYYRNYYAPLQELKKTKNMTWKAICYLRKAFSRQNRP
ncbi:hypothetical protein BHYA_0066g00330 [Botrytis hyacinthi]|uniref:Uncharacterized protein n=1 Tax=Botrytis hyacinthi TaxID=278943 RepID=A0A4Z1GQ28_9HELO|nr:hypothetical protein BHYA_0066g00330 [Botrytis hyacinthi]